VAHTEHVGALGPDLSTRTDDELRRLRTSCLASSVVFAVVLAIGLVLWAFPLPRVEGGLVTLILVLTGALNLPISLYGIWSVRRQVAVRWYERELWVHHEAETPAIAPPTPSVALARLRAKPPGGGTTGRSVAASAGSGAPGHQRAGRAPSLDADERAPRPLRPGSAGH